MTVQAQDSVQYYDGPINVGAVIPITNFTFIDNSHVSLKIRGIDEIWEYGTDYTVEGADTLTRTITLNRVVEAGQVLAAYLDVPITQNISPEEGGNFPAYTNEFVLDKLTYICQMLYERVNRSLQVSVDTKFNGTLPEVLPNRSIKINKEGSGLELSEFDFDQVKIDSERYRNEAEEAKNISIEQANKAEAQANIAITQASNAAASAANTKATAAQALTDITSAKETSINAINLQQTTSVNAVKNEGTTQVNLAKEQATLATTQANIATTQAGIATAKTSEVVESGNNALTAITEQETTSKNNIETKGAEQIELIQNEGATQVNLAKEQTTIATEQATIATNKTNEVVDSGNMALSNIATAKSDALNSINTTGAIYVNNAEQYAQNALTSANNASTSEANALSYKNSALESSQIATEQANIAITNANKAITSATNAKTSEINAKSSEVRCEEILSRLGTAIKIKGRVDSVGDLPLSGNLDGDAYLVGEEGLDSYPEYYWYKDHWEFLGTTGTSLSWGLISGDISNQTDLQTALDSKQDKGNYALKSEIPTNNNQLTNGAGYITSSYHDSTKQDVISDLAIIRAGAAKGATALQNTAVGSATKPIYINSSGVATAITSYEGNSATSTKATQDSAGQQINTTYIKGVTASNATITVTRGNGTTSTATINNVANAINATNATNATKAIQDGDGNVISETYLKKTELDNCYKPPLLSFMWSDHLFNDMSWLRADTFSWQDGTTYSSAYNELLAEYNDSASVEETEGSITFKRTPKGYKIAIADQENAILNKYNSNGIAWYYIIDTTNQRFKLPRMKHKYWKDQSTIPVMGNGNTMGITDGVNNKGLTYITSYGYFSYAASNTNVPVGTTVSGSGVGFNSLTAVGLSTDKTQSGVVADVSDVNIETGFYLYFYVGGFTKSAEAQTVGLNSELLNAKVDLNFNNMNPSQTAKNTIAGWGLPDYSAGVDYANNTTVHTAPSNGVLEISYTVAAVTTGYLKINGIDAAASYHTGGYLTYLTGQYMLSEGDTFQITSPAYVVSGSLPFIYRFYPCKGAN